MFGAFINGLNVALHLKDLWQTRTQLNKEHVGLRLLAENAKWFAVSLSALHLTDIQLPGIDPYLPGLQLCRLRGRGFHWGGHDGRLHCFLLRLLWTWYPERSQRIDPIPGTPNGKRGRASGHAVRFLLTPHARSVNKVNKMPRFPFFTLIIQPTPIQQLLFILFSQSLQVFMQESSNPNFSYLTSSKNLSSSSAGNWESLKGKKVC